MTPGQKVLKALKERGYSVVDFSVPVKFKECNDSEIAGIIEQESGIVEMATALEIAFDILDGQDFGDELHSEPEYIVWKTVCNALEAYKKGSTA